MKSVYIEQSCGLGDILFLCKAVCKLHDKYKCDIIWPVIHDYMWISDYIKYPFIKFVDISTDFDYKNIILKSKYSSLIQNDVLFVPFNNAEFSCGGSVMEGKYKFINEDYSDWAKYLIYERNKEKENTLFYDVLKLSDDIKYTFINRMYHSCPNIKICDSITPPHNMPFIEMSNIQGFTLFDWCKVFERASNIITIDTSLQYILETLKLNVTEYTCFLRYGKNTHDQIKNLFTMYTINYI